MNHVIGAGIKKKSDNDINLLIFKFHKNFISGLRDIQTSFKFNFLCSTSLSCRFNNILENILVF